MKHLSLSHGDCMNGSASERDGAAHRLKRENTVWPIDPISLRPCLLCGLAGRISVPRLRLILVSLAGHLLLSISKLIHLLERCQMQRGKKNCHVMEPFEFKALCGF